MLTPGMRRCVFVSAAALALTLAGPAPAGAGAPPATATSTTAPATTTSAAPVTALAAVAVLPSVGLRDLQAVEVTVSGYAPDAPVGLAQCVVFGAGAGGICHGANRQDVTTDGAGTARATFVVRRVITEALGAVDCATDPAGCAIFASQAAQPTTHAPLSFDAAVPPSGPVITVVPDTGLRDGQTVQVTGSGFTPDRRIKVAQCPAGTFAFEACDLATQVFAQSDAAGSFSVAFTVRAGIRAGGVAPGDVDCRAAADGTLPCTVTAADDLAASEHADVAVSFGAATTPDRTLPRTGGSSAELVLGAACLLALGRFLVRARGRARSRPLRA